MDQGNRNWLYIVIFLIFIVGLVILAGGFYFNYSRIDQLTRALSDTQKQVEDVKEEAREKIEELTPEQVVRLALLKAYATSLREELSTNADQANIDRITLYVEGNPDVLITKNPNLPEDIVEAVTSLKTKAQNLKNLGVAVIKEQIDDATYSQNEVVNLTGVIEFVEDDEVYGGSIFSLTDNESENVFYLHFNETNSEDIKDDMVDEEVTVQIRVTSRANEPLTFEVIKGPTLVESATPTPQTSPTPAQ